MFRGIYFIISFPCAIQAAKRAMTEGKINLYILLMQSCATAITLA
jgi:hypothetical protein